MKRSLLSILSLLTVALAAVAQPRISSNKETHNFGQIEWKRPVKPAIGTDQRHNLLCLCRGRLDQRTDCPGRKRSSKSFF